MAKRDLSLKPYSEKDVNGKTVLVRVDLNIPMNHGIMLDDSRIQAIIPTIKDLVHKKAKVVLLSHFGRPKGEVDHHYSLKPVADILAQSLNHAVVFATDCVGDPAHTAIDSSKQGDIILLENLRFHKGEETNNPAFTQQLSNLGDVFINDAFSVSHRAHASTKGLAKALPSFPGLHLQKELEGLASLLDTKSKPIMAIVAGAKISTKIGVLETLTKHARFLAVGGGIANTFLMAQGINVGNSLVEPDCVDIAKTIFTQAKVNDCKLILPIDARVARDLDPGSEVTVVPVHSIHPSESIFDIGPQTVQTICDHLEHVKTLIWNGPLGLFEHKPFDRASLQIAQTAAHLTMNRRLKSIAGGGETIAVIKAANVKDEFTFLSTGGGAFLEYIEGKPMPGLEALVS